MTDLEMWSGLVGFLLPLVIAVIQQPSFPKPLRAIITLVVCAVAAIVTVSLQGSLDWTRWQHSVLIIAVAALAFYKGTWLPLGGAPALEEATTLERLRPVTVVSVPGQPVAAPPPVTPAETAVPPPEASTLPPGVVPPTVPPQPPTTPPR